jgi:hypothetical protein
MAGSKPAVALVVCCFTASAAEPSRWIATWQSALAQTMQLSLGGTFNKGPAQQNRFTLLRSGVFRSSDSLQLYAWNTTDLRGAGTDTDMGVRYRAAVRRLAGGKVMAGGGLEHWRFPSVLGGTRDAVVDSYLGWTGGEGLPVTIFANGKTLVRSTLQRGTFVVVQAQHSRRIARLGSNLLSVQHGPIYIYSWGVYGRGGHRALRYCAAAYLTRGAWSIEATYRPQAGLQPAIPDNRFWSVGIGRRFGL